MLARAGSARRWAMRVRSAASFIFHSPMNYRRPCCRYIALVVNAYATRETTDMDASHNIGVAARIGSYSDAIEVPPGARWLIPPGRPGLARTGFCPPGFA